MCHSIGHMLRTVTGQNLSAQQFVERLQNRRQSTVQDVQHDGKPVQIEGVLRKTWNGHQVDDQTAWSSDAVPHLFRLPNGSRNHCLTTCE